MTDSDLIRSCIAACARNPDGRYARWCRRKLARALLNTGTSPTIAAATAWAAQRVGQQIAETAHKGRPC